MALVQIAGEPLVDWRWCIDGTVYDITPDRQLVAQDGQVITAPPQLVAALEALEHVDGKWLGHFEVGV